MDDQQITQAWDRTERSLGLERVIDSLVKAGGRPLVVGGWVRDTILGVQSKDVDIEVHSLSERKVLEILYAHGRVDEVGKSFGVMKFEHDVDFSLPRTERMISSGHRGVQVNVDPHMGFTQAAARRDFTINAIGFDIKSGRVEDSFHGRDDLANGFLRHTSDRFSEDPLRVLRGMQFCARFDLEMVYSTVELCRSIKDRFGELSKERVGAEFWKLFQSDRPSRGLQVLIETGWIDHFPELKAIVGTPQDPEWHPEGPVDVHLGMSADAAAKFARVEGLTGEDRVLAVAGAFVHDLGKATHTVFSDGRWRSPGHAAAGVEPVASFLDRIEFPHVMIDKLCRITAEHMCCVDPKVKPTPTVVRRLARRLVPATIEEWARVVEADANGRGEHVHSCAGPWLKVAKTLKVEQKPVSGIITGQHLIDFGMKPGPAFKPILEAAVAAQEEGVFDDLTTALVWLDDYLEAQ